MVFNCGQSFHFFKLKALIFFSQVLLDLFWFMGLIVVFLLGLYFNCLFHGGIGVIVLESLGFFESVNWCVVWLF